MRKIWVAVTVSLLVGVAAGALLFFGGLKGDEIPLEARILRAADVFSALSEARPYKAGMQRERALESMQEITGTKLDPASFAALREAIESGASDP